MPEMNTRQPQDSADWKKELADSFQSVDELLQHLQLDPQDCGLSILPNHPFRFRVTRAFASRMEKSNPADPLLRQVLPLADENRPGDGFSSDPVGDLDAGTVPGVLHKYHGRVLLVTTGHCAINCRYCFRREFPYSDHSTPAGRHDALLDFLHAHSEIREVILSGGDPLVLSDRKIAQLIAALETVGHLQRLRIHSRIPVVLPSRISAPLLRILATSRLKPVMVLHMNHPNELDTAVRNAVSGLRAANIPVFNQAVLLRGVNDDTATLKRLFESGFDAGIQPYYLHALDRARGTTHFEVEDSELERLQENLRTLLPGYLLPRFVRETAGARFKIPV